MPFKFRFVFAIILSGLCQNFSQNCYCQSAKNIKKAAFILHKNSKSGITTVIGRKRAPGDFTEINYYNDALELDSVVLVNKPFFNARFAKNITFENGKFLNDLDFSFSTISGSADFRYVNFNKGVNFESTNFKNADFFYTNFSEDSHFDSTVFSNYVDFDRADFDKIGFFGSSIYKGKASFIGMENMTMDFNGSKFLDTVDFTNTIFHGSVNFNHSTLNSLVNFENTSFDKKAYLSDLKLSTKTQFDFNNATLPDTLDFSYNDKIINDIDFTVAQWTDDIGQGPTCINLYRTDISKLRLDYIHFKLYFSSKNGLTGYARPVTEDEKNMIYEGLLNNFKLQGQTKSFQLLDIEYQRFKLDCGNHFFYKWLFKYWWNYGYNKEYIFNWTLGFILFFSFLNLFTLDWLNSNIYVIESMPAIIPRFKSIKNHNAVWYNLAITPKRFWLSSVYTAAIFFKVTLKIENFKFNHVAGTIYLFMIYIVGLICLAYMANFVLQK